MNKEQIDEIALRVFKLNDDRMFCDTDKWVTTFTHALLAELAKVQEPVAWLQTSVEDGVDTVIARTYKPDKFNAEWWRFDPLYLHPLPQPDLVAEIESLNSLIEYHVTNQKVVCEEIQKLRQQLSAAQEDRDRWVCLHADQVFKTNDEIYIAEGIREQLSAAQRERDICHDECIKLTNNYNSKLSAAQAREAELLKALEEVEAKYFALLKEEDAESEGFKAEGDMYGWNFHTGVRSGAVQMHLYMTNLLKLAAAHKARKGGK